MTTSTPNIWILASPHAGDNTQLMALAENLGWPFEIKKLSYQPWQGLTRLGSPATLFGLTRDARIQIKPLYPDLIIGAGHSTESTAFWIQKHSGNKTKLVYFGTPLAKLDKFDLVITTPQYKLPQQANILHIDLPMHKFVPEKLETAASVWQNKLKHLPKPWTAILIGGSSGPYTFDAATAARLAAATENIQGSLLVTTSARTPLIVTQILQTELQKPNYVHAWEANDLENPFIGFLAVADQFIVTADSVSMLSEACATGKTVLMFDTESGSQVMRDGGKKISLWGKNFYTTLFRFAMRFGKTRWTRDLRIVHHQLTSKGQAQWLGDAPKPHAQSQKLSALEQATTRVKALFEI